MAARRRAADGSGASAGESPAAFSFVLESRPRLTKNNSSKNNNNNNFPLGRPCHRAKEKIRPFAPHSDHLFTLFC